MVETGSHKMYDRLIVVTCDRSLQIALSRDQLSEEEAIARMNSQLPIEQKLKLADYTVDTSGIRSKRAIKSRPSIGTF